jgi:hypothetical protein
MRLASQLFLLLILSGAAVVGAAQNATLSQGHFHFETFHIPNQFVLGVENINRPGVVVGYKQTGTTAVPGPIRGFRRSPGGQLQTLIDPGDVEGPAAPYGGVTELGGINDHGLAVGQFWDAANGHYAGFFLYKGKYTTYNVPGFFNTAIYGVNNDSTDFCGLAQAGPPGFFSSAFVSDHGNVTVFTVPGATFTEALAINNFDQVAGFYSDASGVYHGFLRKPNGGLIFPIDVPGASTTANLGTLVLGINDFGVMSGHFYDSSNREHGFVRLPNGHFFQIDVPNAVDTAGGGLNDLGVVVGHWVDQNGHQIGYIATPDFD